MDLNDFARTADVGLVFAVSQQGTPYAVPGMRPPTQANLMTSIGTEGNLRHQIGFTPPTITYDMMRRIQAYAQGLDLSIEQYVADPIFRAGWNAWYLHAWRPFYEKYAGPDASNAAKLSATFYSDEVAAQAESYRKQLERWEADYRTKLQAGGQPVPAPPGTSPPRPDTSAPVAGLPWWFWTLTGVAAVGLAYWGYRKYVQVRGFRRALETDVVGRIVGPETAKIAARRDPFDLKTYAEMAPSRDPDDDARLDLRDPDDVGLDLRYYGDGGSR